ncbi:MAG: hypothetical protein E7551_04810 [Ruminococcaceae bacterium]|nr:hypothetical protein [Oscillospiraceae bacterium]
MKKVLSIVLILSLMLVNSYAFSISASANDFYAAENWKIYANSSNYVNETNGTLAASWATVTENTNSAYANGDASSLKISAISQKAALKVPVKKNTKYTLSYSFLSETVNTNGRILTSTGILAEDSSMTWGAAKSYYNLLSYNVAYTAKDGIFADRQTYSATTLDYSTANTWHHIELEFESGDNEYMYLVLWLEVANLYVDDVTLKEVSAFENINNWGIYNASSTDTSYQVATNYDGETCQTKMGWCNITNDVTEDADGTGTSIKVNGNVLNVAANLPTLKTNTEYMLSFKYKPSATSTPGVLSNTYYFLSHIIKKGVGFNSSNKGPAEYIATVPSGTATTDWKEVSVTFATDDTTDYMLEFHFGFAAGYICYLDDFKLNEVHPQVNDWKIYANNTAYVNETNGILTGSWATVTTNNDKKYINDNDDCSLKISSINQYATYKFAVEKNAKYTVSFNFMSETVNTNGRILTSAGILAEDSSVKWASEKSYYNFMAYNVAYTAKDGVFADRQTYSATTLDYSAINTWHHIDLEFESGDNEYMYLAFCIAVDDLYVDKITVTLDEKHIDKVNTSYNNSAALRTAENSSTGKNGLRIYNSISKQYLNDAEVVEYGSIVTYEFALDGAELSLETPEDKFIKGVAYNSVTLTTPILYDETDDANIFTAYLTNIPTKRYGENILIRAYVIDADGNVYYGDTVSVCVFDVAYAIDCGNSANGFEPTEADISAFESFANYDGNYAAYDAWLTANGLAAGSIRNS